MEHWRNAIKGEKKYAQYEIIREILRSGQTPQIKILAYKLEQSKARDTYGIVERALQDTFGIQLVWEKRPASERLVHRLSSSTLVQIREDSSKHPVLSLEAAYCKGIQGKWFIDSKALAEKYQTPVFIVGLMKTYQPIYTQDELGEMARMWWNLDRYNNTSLPILIKNKNAILLCWASKLCDKPQIIGVWRINNKWIKDPTHGRWSCGITNDFELRRELIGSTLQGTGNNYQGSRIYLHD